MKKEISRAEAQKKIDEFFQREDFTAEQARKMKRLAMKFKIKLGSKRRMFCSKCLAKLRGAIRVTKTHKTVACASCGFGNKFRIK